jgi:hypothetical protein
VVARPPGPAGPAARSRAEPRRSRLLLLARLRGERAAPRAAPLRDVSAPLHGAREARLAEDRGRGADGASRPLPPDARGRLLVDALLLPRLLRGHGPARFPRPRAPRRPRRLFRGPAGSRPARRPDARGLGGRARRSGRALCAPLLRAAALEGAVRDRPVPPRRGTLDGAHGGPRGSRIVRRGQAERSRRPPFDGGARRPSARRPSARGGLHPVPRRGLDAPPLLGPRRGVSLRPASRCARAGSDRSRALRQGISLPAVRNRLGASRGGPFRIRSPGRTAPGHVGAPQRALRGRAGPSRAGARRRRLRDRPALSWTFSCDPARGTASTSPPRRR